MPCSSSVPGCTVGTVPVSSTAKGASKVGCKRPQAARPRSSKAKTQPMANIGQINCPKYMLKAVSAPTLSSPCHTK